MTAYSSAQPKPEGRVPSTSATFLVKTPAGRTVMSLNTKDAAVQFRDRQQAKLGIPLHVTRQIIYERKVA